LPVEIGIVLDHEETQGQCSHRCDTPESALAAVTLPLHKKRGKVEEDPRGGEAQPAWRRARHALSPHQYHRLRFLFRTPTRLPPQSAVFFCWTRSRRANTIVDQRGRSAVSDDLILQTEGLTKEFAGFVAVNGVDLRVARGTIHALIGPNGAGKTTCFNLLTKFLSPSRGRIVYKGRDITSLPPADVARLGLVRSFQISAVFPHLTVLENVRSALLRKRGASCDFGRSKRVLEAFNERAMALITDVGLASFASWTAVELPYGRKRALEIATTLALEPEMLLLDEPMAGMGHEDVDRISALIKSVAAERTVLMVEHNLSVVANLSHRITVLTRGRVLAEGDYATVSADPTVREAYLGVGHA